MSQPETSALTLITQPEPPTVAPERPSWGVYEAWVQNEKGRRLKPGVYWHTTHTNEDGERQLVDEWIASPVFVSTPSRRRATRNLGPRLRLAMRVLRRAIDVGLALLVVAVVAIGLAANLAPQAGARLLAIRTGSMEPSMPVGSLIVAVAADPAELAIGDVISVSLEGGATLTHRISNIVEPDGSRMFELKGDANALHDPVLVVPAQVVGRVDMAIPLLGYLLAMLSMPTGIAALLAIGGTLLTAGWLIDELSDVEADEDLDAELADRERLDRLNLDATMVGNMTPGGPVDLGYEGGGGTR